MSDTIIVECKLCGEKIDWGYMGEDDKICDDCLEKTRQDIETMIRAGVHKVQIPDSDIDFLSKNISIWVMQNFICKKPTTKDPEDESRLPESLQRDYETFRVKK